MTNRKWSFPTFWNHQPVKSVSTSERRRQLRYNVCSQVTTGEDAGEALTGCGRFLTATSLPADESFKFN